MEWILAVAVSIVAGFLGSRIARRSRRTPSAQVVLPVEPVAVPPSAPQPAFVPARTQTGLEPAKATAPQQVLSNTRPATTDAQRAPTQNGLLPANPPPRVMAPILPPVNAASNGVPTPLPADVATVRYQRLDADLPDDDDEYTQESSIPTADDLPWDEIVKVPALGSAPNYKHAYERADAMRRTVELARMRNALEHLTLDDAGTRPFERPAPAARRTEDSVVAPPSPRDTWPN